MKTIHKFKIQPWMTYQPIELPQGAEFLSIQVQHGLPVMWCLVEPQRTFIVHELFCFGTGHEVPDDVKIGDYLGTLQIESLVLHYFMRTK